MKPYFSSLQQNSQKICALSNSLKFLHRSYHQNSCKLTPTHFNSMLNNATQINSFQQASQIHAQIITNYYTTFPFLLNNLINLYANCGQIAKSLVLFCNIDDCFKNVITWTSVISQLNHYNMYIDALKLFNEMRDFGVNPNKFTFSAIVSACANVMDPCYGIQIHGLICKFGIYNDVFVGSALIGMYGKCFDLVCARKVFDEMPEKNVVSWNSMIVGFLDNEVYDQAILCFKGVLRETSVVPNEVSGLSALTACANMGEGLDVGKQVHGVLVKHGLVASGYVKNSLIDMYVKCGSFKDGVDLFRSVGERDVVAWNVMMGGCVHHKDFEEAWKYFVMMREKDVFPNEASFSIALNTCGGLAALNQGIVIHNLLVKIGFEKSMCVVSSLITMYSKCGSLVDAHSVFEELNDSKFSNVVCLTSMISAFQQHGYSNQVIELFENMLQRGIKPDYRTFVSVLSACAHTRKVEEGFAYFNSMVDEYKINHGHEHYACMVDLLGRSGRLKEAKRFIESMPIKPGPSIWGAFLGACRKHGNLEMAREAAETLFEIEPSNPGNYVILANLYTRKGKSDEADEIRRLMGVNGVRKEPGCSWIDVKNTTHVFTANDKSHTRTREIYDLLREFMGLVKKKGYKAETEFAMNDVEQIKEQNLWNHSERLALAFGLLTLPNGVPIRIKKNLRTCGDCHTVMKLASDIYNRDIIIRDVNRFHHFSRGHCSCGDYW
ncbi:hypothetical protein RND81_04G219900 [Saponaria officinalis]|uniref:DYW domain-containing protein n=1 Tax=Saponaria officinalis TaxID=3572 RepID=A0AAW1LKL9_SAPOF